MKLSNKILRDGVLFVLLLSIPTYFLAYYYSLNQMKSEREILIKKQVSVFKGAIGEALWNLDGPYIKQILSAFSSNEGVHSLFLLDDNYRLVSEISNVTSVEKSEKLIENDITNFREYKKNYADEYVVMHVVNSSKKILAVTFYKDNQGHHQIVGYLFLKYHFKDLREKAQKNVLFILFIVLSIFLILFVTAFLYLQRIILKPLSKLEGGMSRIIKTYDVQIDNHSEIYEITSLINTFNKMTEDLRNSAEIINNQQSQMITISKMSSLGEMAAGVAHEINNPLMIIGGYLDKTYRVILNDENKYSEIKVSIEKAIKGVQRVSKIISGLRTFARNATNDPKLTASVAKILNETIELCRERFKHGHVRLDIPADVNLNILCRESQISQVLLNLLNNAFDAVSQLNLEDKWVRVDIENDGDKVFIKIIDCGWGIPSEVAEKILLPFFTTKEIGKGTGLGLSISVGIIEEHGGNLYYDSKAPNTTFVIELPLYKS